MASYPENHFWTNNTNTRNGSQKRMNMKKKKMSQPAYNSSNPYHDVLADVGSYSQDMTYGMPPTITTPEYNALPPDSGIGNFNCGSALGIRYTQEMMTGMNSVCPDISNSPFALGSWENMAQLDIDVFAASETNDELTDDIFTSSYINLSSSAYNLGTDISSPSMMPSFGQSQSGTRLQPPKFTGGFPAERSTLF
ncbi:hypothetical protein SK128_023841 [Halocaridina rubra]|uniref:Uncharacterized protein n=1 Tax=Halocaridina rubra TaxID=373956 RepID=A0AAN9A820_HALRR